MIEFVLASTTMLAELGSWIVLALLVWFLVGACVALPLAHRLGAISDQYPPVDDEEQTT